MKPAIRSAVRLVVLLIFSLQIGRADASVSVDIQPASQTVSAGQNAVFGAIVTATAGESVTGYQWFKSANSLGPFTGVGTGAALVLDNVQVGDTGYYYVKVAYLSGGSQQTVSSSTGHLTVDVNPRIITQPASLTSPIGSNAVFSITVGGALPLYFQWRLNGLNLADNGHVTGSTGTNLDIENLTTNDSGSYDIVVTNVYGAITSLVATLQVALIPPVITSATNATGKQGFAFDYTIAATGTPPITFGASGLPDGLSVDSTNGAISGVPSVSGVFNITLFATNGAQTAAENLMLTLADDIPAITSATNAIGQQGILFSYMITASNDPALFSASPLPDGLSLNPTNGAISGIPLVSGSFSIAIGATNAYGGDSNTLTLNLSSDVPGITSSLVKNGKEGQSFSYTIVASNNPVSFSASLLPVGLTLNAASGVISGLPLVSGPFAVTIGAMNMFGSDSQTLTLNLATGAPVITSSLTARGAEEQTNFSYTIRASNSPMTLWATGLPMGLTVNTNTGAITGTPLYAGNYNIPLFAANVWGVGTATLQLTITNMIITDLAIADVMTNYSSPYLLEFTFSLRDGSDPATSHAVVASPSLMTVTAFEDDVPVSPSETSVILQRVDSQGSKVIKGYLVLDFTESVASLANGDANSNGISDAVDAEVAAAQDFVNQQPADTQIGVYEFHRDDEVPQQVVPLTTDKNLLDSSIAGIWTNYVQDFPAGSRAWDALVAAVVALGKANSDEDHYIVFMSDGQDDSSINTVDNVITAATNANVQIYAVGFGDELDSTTLQNITTSTMGRYYAATNLADLDLGFAEVGKDLSSEYVLRWATLKRSATSFNPSFQISYQGLTAFSPTNPPPFISGTNYVTVTNTDGTISTNPVTVYTTNYIISPFAPTHYAGNILAGSLRLVSDADVQPAGITLRTTYAPRYISQLRLHYRANWPASLSLESTNPGEMLDGWTLTQTNDGAGGEWALLSSPDPSSLADSIPFASFGNLLTFSFHDPIVASNAFSEFDVDNTIYTNANGTNFYGFTMTNAVGFITVYAVPPPHGTPIPWLMGYGFTTNFANAELLDPNGNGLQVWQDYLAGLDPLDTNSTFVVQMAPAQNPPQIVFNTVVGRIYRIEWAASLSGNWTILRDGIAGTGGDITFTDLRDLTSVGAMFYRVVVDGP
ncbi:MAG TPA: putative Ig domain-containing protein [Verrucomicrobiae bacterium]